MPTWRLYRGGRLAGTSTPVLEDLGVVGQLMDPEAFRSLALEGQFEVTREGSLPQLAERVGYRVVQPGRASDICGARHAPAGGRLVPRDPAARPRAGSAPRHARRSCRGVGRARRWPRERSPGRWPSCVARRWHWARASRCRLTPGRPPLEFEPVFGAFERMAADIRSSQSALEEARRRTAAVLATVATGVVGVDPRGRVLIANRQAVDLLGTPLRGGRAVPRSPRAGVGATGRRGATLPGQSGGGRHRGARSRRTPADAAAGLAGTGGARRGHGAQRCHRCIPGRAGAGLGRDGAAGGARDQEPAHADAPRHAAPAPGLSRSAEGSSTGRWRKPRSGSWARSIGSTPSPGPSAGLPRRPTCTSRWTGSTSVSTVGEVVQLYRLAEEGCEVRLAVEPEAFGAARLGRGEGSGGEPAGERPERGRHGRAGHRRAGAHPGGGRRRRDSRRSCCPASSSPASRPRRAGRDWGWPSCGGWWRAGAGGSKWRVKRGGERS